MDPQPPLLCTGEDVITSTSSMEDIIDALTKRSCSNLTACINLGACSKNPYTGGGFCDLYRGELYNGTKVAIKCLRVYDGPQADDERKKILKHAARELYHWSKLQHRNVLPLMGLALFRGHISMISEWMDNGSLMQYIRLNQKVNRIRLCKEICAGLCYIHASGMIHGDLKSANVMISGHGAALIADFGNSWLKDVTLKFSNTVRHSFSMRWAAPELLLEDECPQATKEADVYAYAMTMLEILTGKIPYEDFSDNRVIVMVAFEKKHPPRPESGWGLNDSLWELLVSCWCQDPSKRPTIKNINDQLCSVFPDSSPGASRNIVDLTCVGTSASDDTVPMSGITPVENVTATLTEHGVVDLTASIDLAGCAVNPFARRGLGTVYKGRLLDNQAVVIKSFRLPPRLYSQEAVKAAATELGFWARLRHRNIMPLMGCASFRDEFAVVYPTIATRIAPSYIRDHPDIDRFSMCIDICSGVSYIHQRGMVHGDLKGENIFVSSDGTAMIGDFGDPLLKALVPAAQVTTRLGTRSRWTAPELFLVDGAKPSRETDVYALGMTILEITTGRVPYEGMSDLAAVHAVAFQQRLPPRPESGIPDGLWDTMVLCWRREPEERPGSASIANRLSTLFWRSRLQGMNLQQVSRAAHTTHTMETHGISRSTVYDNIGSTNPHQPGHLVNRHSVTVVGSQSNGYDQLEWGRAASPDSRLRKTEGTSARVYRGDPDAKLLLLSSGQSSTASAPPWSDELTPELESEDSRSSRSSSSYCTASGDFPENESLDDLT